MSNPYGIPDWNFTILVNDFGDNYWNDSFEKECPEAAEALLNIHDKYSDPASYEEAMRLYNRYIGEAYEYYGGKIAVKYIKKTTKQLPRGIINPPKLNGKGKKKYLAGAQFNVGKYVPVIEGDKLKKLIDIYNKDVSGNEPDYSKHAIDRTIRRELRRGISGMISKHNARASYKESTAMYTTDILYQVIANRDKITSDPYNDILYTESNDVYNMSLDEHVKYYEEMNKEPDSLVEVNVNIPELNDRYAYSNSISSTYSQRLANDRYVFEIMRQYGMTKFGKKERARMTEDQKHHYKNVFGSEVMMSKKEKKKQTKKYKKQTKKYKNDMTRHMSDSNRALASLLSSRSAVNMIAERMDEDD